MINMSCCFSTHFHFCDLLGRAPSKYWNKLALGFNFFIPEVKQYVVYGSGLDRVKQQDSTPQNDSTLGLNG